MASKAKDLLKIFGVLLLLRGVMILGGYGAIHVPVLDDCITIIIDILRDVSMLLFNLIQGSLK